MAAWVRPRWLEGERDGLAGGLTVPRALVAGLNGADGFVIVPHVLPDVDALASAAALCTVLRHMGKRARVEAPEVPDLHAWVLDPALQRADAAAAVRIAVDTARPERLQVPGPVTFCLDHHEDNPGFGVEADWVTPAPSCTCLVAALADALGVEADGALATTLYAGLLGDTSGFREVGGPDAFAWAERFARSGADCGAAAERFHRRSPGFWALLAEVEGAMGWLTAPGAPPLAAVAVTVDQPRRHGIGPYEHAMLPTHLSPPAGGVLVVLQEGVQGVRLRFRSRGHDVLPLAHLLGGGGHPTSAGAQLRGIGLDGAQERLVAAWAHLAGVPAGSVRRRAAASPV